MNPNENPDSKLIAHIDRRLHEGQPSGIPLVDDLAATIPQPRPDFQQQLEDHLSAHYHVTQNGKGELNLVTHTPILDNRPQKKWAFIPLTLAAAMLAVVIIGSIILSPNRNGSQQGLSVSLQETTSPIPLVNVVVALQDLPSGYRFPSSLEELTKVVNYAPWPLTDMPANALREDIVGLNTLLGKVLRADVLREQPIPANQIVDNLGPIENVGFDLSALIPPDKVAVTVPLNLLIDMPEDVKVGDAVDLSAIVRFIDGADTPASIMNQKIVRDAVVVHIGDLPPSTYSFPPDIITLAVFPDEAGTLVSLIQAEVPLTVELFPELLQLATPVISELEAPPTPISSDLGPLVNVVVALQDLPRGYQFPATAAELDNIVDYMTLPEAVLPLDALREDQNGLEQVLGLILKTDVYRQQLILPNLLADDLTQIANIGDIPNYGIPSGQVSISLPVSISEIIASGIRERDTVDLVVSMLFTDIDETFQTVQPPGTVMDVLSSLDDNPPCPSAEPCTITQTIVQNAMILNIEEGPTDMMVTLIVSPQDMIAINWLLEAKLPYILRRTIPEPLQLPTYPGQIPTGMWLSEITFDQLSGNTSNIQQGDVIDISFSFLWQEVESEMSNTFFPENGRVFTTTILQGAKIYKLGESIGGDKKDILTLLLTEEDMILLSSLLKTTVPFAITLTPSNQAALFVPYFTNNQLVLQIPASNLTGTPELTQISNTVNILAQVNFNGYDPTDPNSFQLQGQNTVAQIVARDAQIAADGENSYSVTVSSDDLAALQWALKAGLPLTVQVLE